MAMATRTFRPSFHQRGLRSLPAQFIHELHRSAGIVDQCRSLGGAACIISLQTLRYRCKDIGQQIQWAGELTDSRRTTAQWGHTILGRPINVRGMSSADSWAMDG